MCGDKLARGPIHGMVLSSVLSIICATDFEQKAHHLPVLHFNRQLSIQTVSWQLPAHHYPVTAK